jgi:hypothetical protein
MESNNNQTAKIIMQEKINPSDQQIKIMIEQCKQSLCLLCGGDPDMVDIFSLDNSQKFGAAPGRAKQFFYSICNDCIETEGWMDMVQDIFKSKLTTLN